MSKVYRVKLGTVEGAGRERRSIACPKLVPEMPTILGAALAAKGWKVDEKAKRATKTFRGVEATVDLDAATLGLEAKVSEEVVGRSYQADDNDARGMAEARANAESARKAAQVKVDQKAARAVLAVDVEVREEVMGAVKVALVEALTLKAKQLGQIQSVEQGTDADGRAVTTIRVEV
ncbi:MAG: hypothetical protein JWM10_4435 [Myxococcaceae bacterium]|nr:hypothetical protein [Myxococcaceae bacterium]